MKAIELKERLDKGEDVKMVDVREADEFTQESAIYGSENIPMGKMFVEAKKGNLPTDKKIVTLCSTGSRCQIVARELSQKGFDIDYLEGGIKEFQELS